MKILILIYEANILRGQNDAIEFCTITSYSISNKKPLTTQKIT